MIVPAAMFLAMLVPTADTTEPNKPDPAKTPKTVTVANVHGKVVSFTQGDEIKSPTPNIGTNNTSTPSSTQQGVLTVKVAENVVVPDGVRYVHVVAPVMRNGKVHEKGRWVAVQGSKTTTKHEDIPLLMGDNVKVKFVSDDGKKTDAELKDVKAGEIVEVRMVRPENKKTPITVAEIHILHHNAPAK
jgi:Cu/Ag efflux protein CusF